MNPFKRSLTYLACCGLLLMGCGQGGSEFGNPSKLNISVIGYQTSQLQGLGLASITVNNLTIDVAQVVLGKIKFRSFNVCAAELEHSEKVELEGPFVIDLLQVSGVDALEGITIPNQLYCRIELILKKLETNIDPESSILGRSVLIEGTRADDTPFQLALDLDEEFKLENPAGFVVDGAVALPRFFIAFDLDQWFTGINLNDSNVEISTDDNGDSIIFIDDDHNTEIREQVIENLKLSAELFLDEDNDSELDQDEHSEPLAEGEPNL